MLRPALQHMGRQLKFEEGEHMRTRSEIERKGRPAVFYVEECTGQVAASVRCLIPDRKIAPTLVREGIKDTVNVDDLCAEGKLTGYVARRSDG